MTHHLAAATKKVVTTSGLPALNPIGAYANHVGHAQKNENRPQLFNLG
jgi:hypothetical protein